MSYAARTVCNHKHLNYDLSNAADTFGNNASNKKREIHINGGEGGLDSSPICGRNCKICTGTGYVWD